MIGPPISGTRPILQHWRRLVRFIPLSLSQLGFELNRRSTAACGARARVLVDVLDAGAKCDAGRRSTPMSEEDHGGGRLHGSESAPSSPMGAASGRHAGLAQIDKSAPRWNGGEKLSGGPRFTSDVAPPGMPHARALRASAARAGGLRRQSISCAGVRSGAPVGAARRYCAGHAMGRPSSRAARSGQYGSRSNSRASRTRSAWPVWMI